MEEIPDARDHSKPHARAIAAAGCSHAFQVADRLVVMRRARIAADPSAADTNLEEVERIITG